jgi:hypothetical protein
MTRPAVATVMSARPWEDELARMATTGARVRLVARISDPIDLAAQLSRTDVIVIGSETPWVEPWLFETAETFGTESIGVHPTGDAPGARLVSHATLHFDEDTPTERLIAAAALLGVRR